jgi:glutamyl-tRNA reductase
VLLCLTANHQNASFELLEKLSIGSATTASELVSHPDISGAVVLATCNRFEAYLDMDVSESTAAPENTDAPESRSSAAIDLISQASGVDTNALHESLTVFTDERAVEHLFAVSTGLESVIVGEDEISGQVRRSLERARLEGTTSSRLEMLFQNASRTARGVRSKTPLGGAGRSLVRLALELAASRITDWSSQRVLVVGTGQYAGTTIAALRDRGVQNLTVFSPSGRGAAFALRHSLSVADSLEQAFEAADLIITCTSAPTPVVTSSTAAAVTPGRYRLVIDLGLPRNVHPDIAQVDGIELLDLETVQLHAPLDELTAADDARSLACEATADYLSLEAEQLVAPAIVALRSHVAGILDDEIARVRAHGDEGGKAEAALRHLVGVLLHTPSSQARELARDGRGDQFVAGLDALFGIHTMPQSDAESADDAATA